MNKRQRKKKIDKVFNKMLLWYLNGLIDTRKFLFSTWDEEYPVYSSKPSITPDLNN